MNPIQTDNMNPIQIDISRYKRIKYATFRRKVDPTNLNAQLKYDFFFRMHEDWRTTYYSGIYNNEPVYILKHLKDCYIFQV